ncbi:MAG: glycosyltransferase family 9 protein [Opitutales bacterium]
MKKILIIREGAIGDVVHTTNVFRSIKETYPNVEIDYVTGPVPAQLLQNDSRLNRVIVLESKKYSYLFKLASKLRKEKYDLIINLQPSLRFKFLAFMCFAKKVVNYKKTYKLHAVENFFRTAKKALKEIENPNDLKLEIPDDILERVKADIPQDKKIVIFNTQASPSRQGRKWPMKNYKELALSILENYDCYIYIAGSKEDAEKAAVFENLHPDIKIIAGKYSIAESAAVFSLADVFVSGDTGPLHIASATEKPYCIGLYGSMPVCRTGPWGINHFALSADLSCIPCNNRKCQVAEYNQTDINPCMCAIKPEHVLRVIIDNDLLL